MTAWDARRRVPAWIYVAVAAAVIVLAAIILLAMGRTFWYREGSIKLWYGDAWGLVCRSAQRLCALREYTAPTAPGVRACTLDRGAHRARGRGWPARSVRVRWGLLR